MSFIFVVFGLYLISISKSSTVNVSELKALKTDYNEMIVTKKIEGRKVRFALPSSEGKHIKDYHKANKEIPISGGNSESSNIVFDRVLP